MKGFKKTKLGWIPEDWEVKKMNELAVKITSGSTPRRSNFLFFENGDISWMKTTDLTNGNLLISEEKITQLAFSKSGVKILPKDTVLVAMYGGFNQIGRTGLLKVESSINQALSAIITNKSLLIPRFLIHWLNYGVGYWKRYAASSRKDPNITKKDVEDFLVILPPLQEQKAIADCLGKWDEAIQLQQQLIEQLQARKKWLMQVLLTGKKRLPGFEGEWREVKMKEVAEHFSLKNKSNKDILVLSCTKYDGLVPSLQYFGRKVYGDDLSKYKIVPNGYFAYATNHIEEGSIGYQSEYEEGLVSPMYTVFKTDNDVNDSFLYRVLKSHRLIYEYNARMEGSIDRRGGLRWNNFSLIKFPLPTLQEQTAIAAVLNQADEELGLQQRRLEQLEEQKKGMMQQLLTGKKRLIEYK